VDSLLDLLQQSGNCHGIMSSASKLVFYSHSVTRRMHDFTPMCPKWSQRAEPHSRIFPYGSHKVRHQLAALGVSSMPVNIILTRSPPTIDAPSESDGTGNAFSKSMPRSIFSQVKPVLALLEALA